LDIDDITVGVDFLYLFLVDIEYIAVAVGFEIYTLIDLYLAERPFACGYWIHCGGGWYPVYIHVMIFTLESGRGVNGRGVCGRGVNGTSNRGPPDLLYVCGY
jgi:hypothetical protein